MKLYYRVTPCLTVSSEHLIIIGAGFPGLDVFHVIVPTFSKYYGNTLQAKVDFYYNTF